MIFKEYIKSARERKGVTQEEAGKLFDYSTQTIANWEAGRAKPDWNMFSTIARTYDVDLYELLESIGSELLQDETNENTDCSNEKRFFDILPDNLNYNELKNLKFSDIEQEVFITLAMYAEFGTNPTEKLCTLTEKTIDLCIILDKLRRYNLYYSEYNLREVNDSWYSDFRLSEEGTAVFKIIKHNKNKLFNINTLSFVDFLNILSIYKVLDKEKTEEIIEAIENIGTNGLLIETHFHSEEKNSWDKKYLSIKHTWCGEYFYNKDNFSWNRNGLETKYIEYISELLSEDFYKIIEFEVSDEMYLIEKEAYKKKLEFYNLNKDEYDGIQEPKKFEELYNKKLILSDKGLKFLKEVERSYKK